MSNMNVKESAKYDNYLDEDKRLDNDYKATLDKFVGEEIDVVLPEKKVDPATAQGLYKILYCHFRNLEDFTEFCCRIGQIIDKNTKETFYPLADPATNLFGDTDYPARIEIPDNRVLIPKEKKKGISRPEVNANHRQNLPDIHWKGMPEFVQEDLHTWRSVDIKFRTKADYDHFASLINPDLSDRSKATWFPKLEVTKNHKLRWVQATEDNQNPKYPVYIVSKGRHESMITSRSLARMKVPHYIIIEPQDEQLYEEALDNFNIRDYVTLLVAPFSNHGDGPGRARNWAWDHSIETGHDAHWVMDDNMSDFYRLHENQRVRFESGVGFKVMEDFVDRYENVYISGPQYRFFIPSNAERPAYVANTRIYSCLLIRNDCPHRWRGRYNEDTDICLRLLKDGLCTVQFNAFLQGKVATQVIKGGNTAEFYHAENEDNEEFKETGYNADGTINKSKMLYDMHPDVTTVVWKYGRWHHHVNYEPFKGNILKLKEGVTLPEGHNNYNMVFDGDFHDARFR